MRRKPRRKVGFLVFKLVFRGQRSQSHSAYTMSKQLQAKFKAQAFQNRIDPRLDSQEAINAIHFMRKADASQENTFSTPAVDVIPAVSSEAFDSGKATTPLARPQADIQTPVVSYTEAPQSDPSDVLYYGDSIATGLGHGGARGNSNSDAMWGRGAADTLALLNSRPMGTFKGKDVVLSSGVLNSGADWDIVRSQIKLLQNRGANSIHLVGAPSNSERFGGYNEQLSSISGELGINFLGGYTPGNDGVHFDYSNSPVYRALK